MNTIYIKGHYVQKEVVAAGNVTPGMSVTIGGLAGGGNRRAYALENDLTGEGITDVYASGDLIKYGVFSQGAEIYGILASGQNVAKGAELQDNGSGYFTAAVSGDVVTGYAMEAVNASGAAARITVEIA